MRASGAAKRWRQGPRRPKRKTGWRPSAPRMAPMTVGRYWFSLKYLNPIFPGTSPESLLNSLGG